MSKSTQWLDEQFGKVLTDKEYQRLASLWSEAAVEASRLRQQLDREELLQAKRAVAQ